MNSADFSSDITIFDMKALILAAGKGTRLLPLTEKKAKPTFPILGVPTLWYPIWWIRQQLGITNIAVNVHHAPETVREALAHPPSGLADLSVHVSDETHQLLGSAGALAKVRDWLGGEPLLVANADSICFPQLSALVKTHQKCKGRMTLHVRDRGLPIQQGQENYTEIVVDEHRRVLDFKNKAVSGAMFSGFYVVESDALTALPEGPSDLMDQLLRPLSLGRELFAYREDVPWFDTGNPRAYADAVFSLAKLGLGRELWGSGMKPCGKGWVSSSWSDDVCHTFTLGDDVVLEGPSSYWPAGKYGPRFLGLEDSSAKLPRNRDDGDASDSDGMAQNSRCGLLTFGSHSISI